jgi:hypothetical protein
MPVKLDFRSVPTHFEMKSYFFNGIRSGIADFPQFSHHLQCGAFSEYT